MADVSETSEVNTQSPVNDEDFKVVDTMLLDTNEEALIKRLKADYDKEIDSIIEKTMRLLNTRFLGTGIYQMILVVTISLSWATGIGLYSYSYVFSGFTPDHKCVINDNVSTPVGNCEYRNNVTNQTHECSKWTYDKSQMKSTIITEYDLVCKRNYHFELLFTIEQTGYIIGAIVSSTLADRFGKKVILFSILLTMTSLGFIQYFSKNLYFYMLFGFFINMVVSGLDGVCPALVLEAFETHHRTRYGMAMAYIWVVVFAMMSPLAYFVNTWRELRLVMFIILAVLLVVNLTFTQESLTWLISTGRLHTARNVAGKIAKINQISKDETFKLKFSRLRTILSQLARFNQFELLKHSEKEKPNSYIEILKYPKFVIYVAISVFGWACAGIVYDGLTYLNTSIGENIFINWLWLSMVEIPAQIICHYFIAKFGRTPVVSLTFILTGLSLLVTNFEYIQIFKAYKFVKVIAFIAAKFFVSISYTTIIIHSAEVFPTNIRSFCCGLCMFSNRVTTSVAPFISLYLSKLMPWLPTTIYGIIAILCGLTYVYAPETLNRPLPNSIQDALQQNKNKKVHKRLC